MTYCGTGGICRKSPTCSDKHCPGRAEAILHQRNGGHVYIDGKAIPFDTDLRPLEDDSTLPAPDAFSYRLAVFVTLLAVIAFGAICASS